MAYTLRDSYVMQLCCDYTLSARVSASICNTKQQQLQNWWGITQWQPESWLVATAALGNVASDTDVELTSSKLGGTASSREQPSSVSEIPGALLAYVSTCMT